ncbi:hypothetical protein [Paenibacillus sp. MER TA 81-3]|nr:hypothetical protein [Paenibacillus sp. MER TA 81-3]
MKKALIAMLMTLSLFGSIGMSSEMELSDIGTGWSTSVIGEAW